MIGIWVRPNNGYVWAHTSRLFRLVDLIKEKERKSLVFAPRRVVSSSHNLTFYNWVSRWHVRSVTEVGQAGQSGARSNCRRIERGKTLFSCIVPIRYKRIIFQFLDETKGWKAQMARIQLCIYLRKSERWSRMKMQWNQNWSIESFVHCVACYCSVTSTSLTVPEIDPHKTIVNGFVCPPCYESAIIISLFTNLRILIFWYMKETIREKHTKPVAASASPL